MKKRQMIGIYGLLALLLAVIVLLRHHNFAVLNPAGQIASKERNLIIFAAALSFLVVVPVFSMTIYIVWKYRASKKSTYNPDWDHSRTAETIWWTVPTLLILILAVVTWNSAHDLDPFKPIASSNPSINIQVIALDWKWLFIYPQLHIASLNMMEFPKDTPVNLQITSDAPMNSLWIPQLSGQVYAMSGMSTQLHIMATKLGDYRGVSANISGRGFAGMHFLARASTQSDFDIWVSQIKQNGNALNSAEYGALVVPTENSQVAYYSPVGDDIYDSVISKYNGPVYSSDGYMSSMGSMSGMGTQK
jgi:cytochrome o ubiquinol oxidase subunit 2